MARWLRLDDKIINLDQVTLIAPRKRHVRIADGGESAPDGASISMINGDGTYTSKSVDEVLRLIESLEGPEHPQARITDHDFDAILGGMYECAVCSKPKEMHAR